MSHDDRRKDFRADLRTVVNVYTTASRSVSPPTFTRAWSEDVSATGSQIISIDPISETRIWLKFLIPGQSDCFIEAEIVRSGRVSRSQFRTTDMLHCYGVRFCRLMTEQEFLELSLDQVVRLTADLKSPAITKRASELLQSVRK